MQTILGVPVVGEGQIKEYYLDEHLKETMIGFNQQYLSVSVPNDHRVESSNYNPILGWNVGISNVSLNIQNDDMYSLINDAKFKENNENGFILKRDFLLNSKISKRKDPILTLSLDIISTQIYINQKSDDYIFPFVRIKAQGMEIDFMKNHD